MRVHFYIAVAAFCLAVVALGLTFVPVLGVYSLITSVVLELSALSLFSTQKNKQDFKALKVLTIITWVLLGISIALFVGGLIYVIFAQ